ncbi:MAG: HAMP domain-containing histidine kinase [Cyclobacteriaceae bacterium]|nr:HAMP domain-containing histidine kinase [Cyclobacteriaceae bacterium]
MATSQKQPKSSGSPARHFIEDLRSTVFSTYDKTILFRLGGLLVTMFLLVGTWLNHSLSITISLFAVLLVVQVVSLLKYLHEPNNEVSEILNAIKKEDYSPEAPNQYNNATASQLHAAIGQLVKQHKAKSSDKNEEFLFFKNIVQHAGIGLIAIDAEGKVEVMNTAAKKLLQVYDIKYISELQSLSNDLVNMFFRLKTGGRDLAKLKIDGELVQLSVYAIELVLKRKVYKMITIQNINSELEEMEMEAWQNLVRVLTHEIMNSVTPISSLAATVEGDLKSRELENNALTLEADDKEDLLSAVQTIQRRSDGLIRFVRDFRNLTHIPQPNFEPIKIKDLMEEINLLLSKELIEHQIGYSSSVKPDDLTIEADKALIEQVLINLIKNAMQAFDEETNRLVQVSAYKDDKGRPVITVKDNGCGIDEEAMSRIFVPFFTTKKSGSGIGLSLSRQIMRKHKGTLTVNSQVDEGTEFIMRF